MVLLLHLRLLVEQVALAVAVVVLAILEQVALVAVAASFFTTNS
jgi:hypothetical protein